MSEVRKGGEWGPKRRGGGARRGRRSNPAGRGSPGGPALHVSSGWREFPGYSIDASLGVAEEVFCRLGEHLQSVDFK